MAAATETAEGLLSELRAISDEWPAEEQEAYTVLAQLLMEGWAPAGRRPGWYWRVGKPGRRSVVVPINPNAADFGMLLEAAKQRLAS